VYYLYALIFVAFSVDVLFLFPVALIYNEKPGWLDFGEVLLFVGILALVIVYAWKKGVFSWKSKLKSPQA
jgi:NADH-quinone oxidoreductase subunit A